MKENYIESFILECKNTEHSLNSVFSELRKNPEDKSCVIKIKQEFEKLQHSAEFVGCQNLERLFYAAGKVFESVFDEYIFYSKRLEQLLTVIEKNLDLSLKTIEETSLDSADVTKTIEYCDRVAIGEIVDFTVLEEGNSQKEDDYSDELLSEWNKKAEKIKEITTVEVERSQLSELFENFEGMISKTFRIEDEVEASENQTAAKNVMAYCHSLRGEIENLRDEIDNLRMLPFSSVCNELRKNFTNVSFNQDVEKIHLDSEVLTCLVQILPVFFKESKRKIQVSAVQGKYETTITLYDKALKIDFEAIRAHALKLYPERAARINASKDEELSAFLFLKSFADSRLCWVLNLIDKVRGKIYIKNVDEGGAKTVMIFPNSLSTRRGLFVKAGTRAFFIPANHIQDVISKWRSEMFMEQNQYFINFEDSKLPVYRLASLFKEKGSDSGLVHLLIIEYLEMKIAIAVDEVSAYSSITFRALPEAFKNCEMLLGVAIDSKMRMIPILNVTKLLIQLRETRGFEIKKMDVLSKIDKPKILVVDDSDTSREIEGSILQANGFAVDEAADGILAMEKLKDGNYDVIVTDTDMPRMNGLIFLENVRLTENHKNVPVVVITPNKDRAIMELYKNAGANAFLSKNDFKRSNLIEMVKNFVRENEMGSAR